MKKEHELIPRTTVDTNDVTSMTTAKTKTEEIVILMITDGVVPIAIIASRIEMIVVVAETVAIVAIIIIVERIVEIGKVGIVVITAEIATITIVEIEAQIAGGTVEKGIADDLEAAVVQETMCRRTTSDLTVLVMTIVSMNLAAADKGMTIATKSHQQ